MGYSTVMRVPKIADYKAAYKIWNDTKPIKGRAENEPSTPNRPLGQRRDVDTYSIRKNVWTEAIECVLYQTPVIKFNTQDEVTIGFGQWSSASTCQFITRILYPYVGAHRVRGDVVLHLYDGSKQIVKQNEELVLVRGANGAWVPKEAKPLYDYRVNRKEANNVRAMCGTFRKYMKGIASLKGETVTQYGVEYERVQFTFAELMEVFGAVNRYNDERLFLQIDEWAWLTAKPSNYTKHDAEKHEKSWRDYRETAAKFLELIKDDQDDNCRHQNYWIAFCILFVHKNYITPCNKDYINNRVFTAGSNTFEKLLDEALFTMFAEKVFKRVELPRGSVPTGKYDKYFGVA